MPFQIVGEDSKMFGSFIRLSTIKKMVENFVINTHKNDPKIGKVRPLEWNKDSHSVYFTKDEIDMLFASNQSEELDPSKYGLRIYFAYHSNSKEELDDMQGRPEDYLYHHTAILVCTHDKNDLLSVNNYVSQTHPRGKGLEEGQICPPPAPPCRGKLIFPQ